MHAIFFINLIYKLYKSVAILIFWQICLFNSPF